MKRERRESPKSRERRDRLTAAAITMGVVGVLLLVLFFGGMPYHDPPLAEASIPELMPVDPDEELFIAPDLIQDAGEPEASADAEPSPVAEGVEEAKSTPDPKPKAETALATDKPARTQMKKDREKTDVKKPEKEDREAINREREKAAENVRKGFSKPSATAGSGGSGVGVAGSSPGRRFLGCDKPDIALREKTVVTVSMTVDADGHVTAVGDVRGGTREMQTKCKAAAWSARWSAKKGAAPTPATLTFTITPR